MNEMGIMDRRIEVAPVEDFDDDMQLPRATKILRFQALRLLRKELRSLPRSYRDSGDTRLTPGFIRNALPKYDASRDCNYRGTGHSRSRCAHEGHGRSGWKVAKRTNTHKEKRIQAHHLSTLRWRNPCLQKRGRCGTHNALRSAQLHQSAECQLHTVADSSDGEGHAPAGESRSHNPLVRG
jgi:hypothetical protein